MNKEEYLDKIAQSDGKEKYFAILKYAWYLRQKDPQESAIQSKKVLDYAREQAVAELELKALTYLCYACFYASDMEETNRWVEQLEKAGKKYDNSRAIGAAYSMKSRMAIYQNNSAEAMEHALTALDYNLKDNDPKVLTSSYFSLGAIHLQRKEYSEAKHYFQLALRNAEESHNHTEYSIRVNIGNILYYEKKYEEALQEYLICFHYFQKHDMANSMAAVLLNIGLCYRSLGNNETALENMTEARKVFSEMKNFQKLGFTINAIAEIDILEENWEKARENLRIAEQLAEKNSYKLDLADCYSNYVKFYEKQEEYLEANNYLHKLLKLREEINQENNQEKLSILETQYKTEIYRLKNTELDKKNKAINKQNKKLHKTLEDLQNTYQKLQHEFQEVVNKLNAQDDLLTSQSRMAMMGELISTIAHQWKQPLNVIWVMAQAIGDAWDFKELDDDFMKNQLKMIGEQVMYMSETINDFRDFFNQNDVLNFKVADTINKAINLVSYMMNKNGISLIQELDDTCYLNGNPNDLSQVLINILNNANDAMIKDQIKDPCIKVILSGEAESIIIIIFNKGKQIEPENLDKIFEPYYTTKGEKGTGIGLTICRKIIEKKFAGKIIARNIDNGVQFEITLPKEREGSGRQRQDFF